MPPAQRQLQIHPSKFKMGENISPTFSGGAINTFNALILPLWTAYLGAAKVRRLIEAGYFRIGVNDVKAIAKSPGDSSPDEIKKNTVQHKRAVDFLKIVCSGYEYDFRLSQDAFLADELVTLLTAETPPAEFDEPAVEEVLDDGDGDEDVDEESEQSPLTPAPQAARPVPPVPVPPPRAAPAPVPKPAPVPQPEPEPVPTLTPAPVEVVVAEPVLVEPEPTPIAEAPVEEKPAMSVAGPPAKATRKSVVARKTATPEKKAASAKKKPPTKKPAVKKSPPLKSPALQKTETDSKVRIKPEVTDLDREIAFKTALLAELQQLRKDTLARAAEIEKRLAQAHGQKH